MNQLFSGLGRFVVRYRYLVVVAWIAVAIVSTKALPSLASEVNSDNSQFLPATSLSQQAADLASPLLGATKNLSVVTIVAAREGSALTVSDQGAIAKEVAEARRVPTVAVVQGLGLSVGGRAAQILVVARVGFTNVSGQTTLVDNLHATFGRVTAPSGLALHLAGDIAVNAANQQSAMKTQNKTTYLSLVIVVLLLLLIFRSLLGPIVTLLPPALTLVVSMRFIGGLGADGLKISGITPLLLVVLLIGAGTDYGLFLVFRVREEVRAGLEPTDAIVRSLVRVGESITASAGTVILALLTLLLATFGVYSDLGIPLALAVAVMLLAGLTLTPALLAIFGRAVFWPSSTSSGTNSEALWGRVAARLVERPVLTLVAGVLLFLGLSAAALGFHSGGFGGTLTAPPGSDAAAGNAILAKYFPKSSANPTNLIFRYTQPVWDSPARIEVAKASLVSSGQFRQIVGPLNPNGYTFTPSRFSMLEKLLRNPQKLTPFEPPGLGVSADEYNAYRATAVLVSPDGRTIQFEAGLSVGDPGSTAAIQDVARIRSAVTAAARASGAVQSGAAGQAPALADVSSASNSDLAHIIPVAIVAIGVLLALVLRSLIAPLYLIVSVGLSYFAALGVSTIVFIDVGGNKGLTFILPFLMFIFLLALGEDYNILVMSRIREEAHHRTLREAVIRAVGRTGATVTSAGLVLAGSFFALAVAGDTGPGGGQVRAVGFGLAIGILMDTFFVRTLLVPSTVELLGRWNWWPAKMGRKSAGSTGIAVDDAGAPAASRPV